MSKAREIQKRQESLEKRKKEREIFMQKTTSEKIVKSQQKEEIIVHKKNIYEIHKEVYDNKIKEKITTLNERVLNI